MCNQLPYLDRNDTFSYCTMIYQIWQWLHSHSICNTSKWMCIFVHNLVCTAHKKVYSITVGKYNRLNNSASLFLCFLNKTIRCNFCHFSRKGRWPCCWWWRDKNLLTCWPDMTFCIFTNLLSFALKWLCAFGNKMCWWERRPTTVGVRVWLWVGDKINRRQNSKHMNKKEEEKKSNKRVNRLLTCRKKEFETFSVKMN